MVWCWVGWIWLWWIGVFVVVWLVVCCWCCRRSGFVLSGLLYIGGLCNCLLWWLICCWLLLWGCWWNWLVWLVLVVDFSVIGLVVWVVCWLNCWILIWVVVCLYMVWMVGVWWLGEFGIVMSGGCGCVVWWMWCLIVVLCIVCMVCVVVSCGCVVVCWVVFWLWICLWNCLGSWWLLVLIG